MYKMTRERFKELCGENGARLYVARIYNEEESFYKVGITSRESSYKRLLALPYNFRILQEISHSDPYLIFNLEKYLISLSTRYAPKIPFGGQSECVENVDAILEYLGTLAWLNGLEIKGLKKVKRPEGSYRDVSREYIEAITKLKNKQSLSKEEVALLEQTKIKVEEDSRFEALVEYISIFGADRSFLELSYGSLRPQVLKEKITKHHDLQLLKEILKSKYKKGDILSNEDLKQEFKRVSETYSLTTKFKISDIKSILKFTTTSVTLEGKKYNAIKIVAFRSATGSFA